MKQLIRIYTDGRLRNTLFGIIGEETGFEDIKVGDVLEVNYGYDYGFNMENEKAVIVKVNGNYCLMGSVGISLFENNGIYKIIRKVVDSSNLTSNYLDYIHKGCFEIREE